MEQSKIYSVPGESSSTSADETPYLTMRKVSASWCSLLLGTAFLLGTPFKAVAQTSLTSATVESLRNRVHLIPTGNRARLARVSDVMSIGDALRTTASARAELRFNDGSLARVGEQATFRFTPNTRNFQLSNGTVLLLIPPGRGRTTIQTPNAVTGIQGSALFVRVRCLSELTSEGYCASPVTFVGALTNNPAGAMMAYNESGSQQQPLYAGEMVVIEEGNISQRLEFDLLTFYQTAGLAEGLGLDNSTPPPELSEDLQGVWQEIQDALELQGDFDSQGSPEEIVENPDFIAPVASAVTTDEALLSTPTKNVFAGFPGFVSSPAASFHGVTGVATSQPTGSFVTETAETPEGVSTETGLIHPITSARVRESLDTGTATAINQGGSSTSVSPTAAIQSSPTTVSTTPITTIPATQPSSTGGTLTPTNVVTTSTPTTPVAVQTVTPQTIESAVAQPTTTAPITTVPVTTTPVVGNVTAPPTTAVAPAPVVTTPVVTAPVVTAPVVTAPTTAVIAPTTTVTPPAAAPVVTTPAPVVTAPTTAPIVVVPPTPVVTTIPEPLPVIPEADQAPIRETVSESAFDWQSAGTNDPEVLQGPSLSESEIGIENIPESQPGQNTEPNIEL